MGSNRKCPLCSMLGQPTVQDCAECSRHFCQKHIVWSPERERWECRRDKKRLDKRVKVT